ncbi:hypothetical protein SLA2020_507500 [Shorea laevis]
MRLICGGNTLPFDPKFSVSKKLADELKWFQQVFEKLGPSLYDFLHKNNHRSFPIDLVWELGRQILESVVFMHDLHLIHTDLKPENILLLSSEYVKIPDCKFLSQSRKDGSFLKNLPRSSAIELIDFGSTTFENQDHSYIVSTQHYHAPDFILGLGWNYPCDLWSVSCILVELRSGEALFQIHENLEHLAMMERVLGPLPRHMALKADHHAEKYFRKGCTIGLARWCNFKRKHECSLEIAMSAEPNNATSRDALRHLFFARDLTLCDYPF